MSTMKKNSKINIINNILATNRNIRFLAWMNTYAKANHRSVNVAKLGRLLLGIGMKDVAIIPSLKLIQSFGSTK